MNIEWFLGLKYLKARRKETFISIITLISIAGVTVGVMALIVVLSVMSGAEHDLKEKIMGLNAHGMIFHYDGDMKDYRSISKKVEKMDGVVATSPFIYTQVMLMSSRRSSGVLMRGVDPDKVTDVLRLKKYMKAGSISLLHKEGSLLMGKELAFTLGLWVGDKVQVISPKAEMSPIGRIPRMRVFTVVGIFDSGLYEYDSSLVFTSVKSCQRLLGKGDVVTGIEVRVKEPLAAYSILKKVIRKLGPLFWFRDWMQMNKTFFSALKLEKMAMFVILTLIVVVASFNIASTLIVVVMEKAGEIAILKSLGATSRMIMKIFFIQGLVIGIVGTIIGLFSGLSICYLLAKYKFIKLPSEIYNIGTLPVQVKYTDVISICIAAILITLLATVYPAWRASKLNVVEALRNE